MQQGPASTQLYNLDTDPREQTDLAAQYPDIVAELERIMAQEHTPPAVPKFRIKALDE